MKTKNLLKKAFLLLALMGGASSAWGNQTSLIENVTLPDMPTSSLDLSSQTTYTPDANGWIVFDPYNIANNPTWWNVTSKSNQKSGVAFNPASASTTAPFVAKGTDDSCIKINSNGTVAAGIRFTGAEKASFLVNARAGGAGKDIYISLFSFASSTQTLVETKTALGNICQEVCFDGLTVGTTYIAYIYNTVSQNSSLMEIALKAPVSNPPGAISFSPAAGSVAAGASVSLTSSEASTIEYQWGASAIGEGGDWSGAVTYSGENKPVVPAAGSVNTVLSVKATNANGSTYGSAAYTPVKMALKTIYSFADGIGSQEVAADDASVGSPMSLGNTAGRIKLTAATGLQFENGDAITFSGSMGNSAKAYGIKYGPSTSLGTSLNVAAGAACYVSGTLTLSSAADNLYIGRYDGTTTNFVSFVVRRLVAATSEAYSGVKIDGSAATEGEDYAKEGNVITLDGTYSVTPNVALVNHIVFADESVEDQSVAVAFGLPDGEFFTGTATIDGTTYTVKAPCGQINALKVEYKDGGTTIKEEHIDVTGLKVGASYTVPFRMYVEKDGALYQTTKNGSNPWYGDVVTLAYNTTVTKTVTPVDLGGGTLELLEDLDDSGDNGASTRASNCSAYINKGYTSASNLPAGKYKFIFRVENINDRDSYIKVGDTEVYRTKSMAKGAWNDIELNDVIIPADGALTLAKSGSAYDGYDILIAIRTGDAVVNITPANAWSTYVTPYALDFSDVEGGLKAYVATAAAAGKVTLDPVGAVPAGTPLMLVGTASTEYTVPVIAPVSAPETNMFRAGDGTTEFNAESTTSYDYILFTDGKFYRIATDTTVPVGKAYLHCTSDPTTPLARELRISFGDNITGIEQIDNGQLTIDNSQDGKFIENGKLVIVKNGVKYNAAGAQVK